MTTAELLTLARGKNDEFHRHQQAGRQAHAIVALRQARMARWNADFSDPDHLDAAWSDDKADHAHIMEFYAQYLARADA